MMACISLYAYCHVHKINKSFNVDLTILLCPILVTFLNYFPTRITWDLLWDRYLISLAFMHVVTVQTSVPLILAGIFYVG
ncbi:hypothetical protein F4815DRAFT_474373 [Daldinia loculata]|nr:hypothetical protein F4815DRAFT_474373 [Daldinia loculata]